jgi:16S rRNA (guanine527-N7)-methyltransferase
VKQGDGASDRPAIKAATELGLPLRPDQVERLIAFEELLRRRAVPLGLLSKGDEGRLWDRHVLDSLRAAALVDPADRVAVDLGSGAGLPGIVVAIAGPHLRVHLVEPKQRRVAFLELAVERLRLTNVSVIACRTEDVDIQADLATARALAQLERSWSLARPLLRAGGRLLYFSGPSGGVPEPPPGASHIRIAPKRLVDSPGPIVIITRE